MALWVHKLYVQGIVYMTLAVKLLTKQGTNKNKFQLFDDTPLCIIQKCAPGTIDVVGLK